MVALLQIYLQWNHQHGYYCDNDDDNKEDDEKDDEDKDDGKNS